MRLFVDGNEVEVQNDVTVVYEGLDPDAPGHELHVRLTCEGLITDLVDGDGEVIATNGRMAVDLAEDCY
jgi:hypothetical protein